MLNNQRESLSKRVDYFLNDWHSFPIDFWWRKKYNISFGSKAHREMNFIDMLIEYREQLEITKRTSVPNDISNEDYASVGYADNDNSESVMTQAEIDKDFEDLDISQFDTKEEENA